MSKIIFDVPGLTRNVNASVADVEFSSRESIVAAFLFQGTVFNQYYIVEKAAK